MPIFDVFLERTYKVRMDAADRSQAARLAEKFVGGALDASTPEQRAAEHFQIHSVETVGNHTSDAKPVSTDDLYRIDVPTNGTAKVDTKIQAREPGEEPIPDEPGKPKSPPERGAGCLDQIRRMFGLL